MHRKVNYVLEADIKGFFDNVDHDWLMKFLSNDIQDKNFLRYVKRFLVAGVMEGTELKDSECGTPQGLISPILANVYLHYVLDWWFENSVKSWLRTRLTEPADATMKLIAASLRGHCNYYGISGNYNAIYGFSDYVKRMTFKMLNRRSQRKGMKYTKSMNMWRFYVKPIHITCDIWHTTPMTV